MEVRRSGIKSQLCHDLPGSPRSSFLPQDLSLPICKMEADPTISMVPPSSWFSGFRLNHEISDLVPGSQAILSNTLFQELVAQWKICEEIFKKTAMNDSQLWRASTEHCGKCRPWNTQDEIVWAGPEALCQSRAKEPRHRQWGDRRQPSMLKERQCPRMQWGKGFRAWSRFQPSLQTVTSTGRSNSGYGLLAFSTASQTLPLN